ncbi:hypothetical protein PanWU01x14_179780, partial [Parasponia andersonii]
MEVGLWLCTCGAAFERRLDRERRGDGGDGERVGRMG